jgi:hypothetical protein
MCRLACIVSDRTTRQDESTTMRRLALCHAVVDDNTTHKSVQHQPPYLNEVSRLLNRSTLIRLEILEEINDNFKWLVFMIH